MPYIDTNSRSTRVLRNELQEPLGRQQLLTGLFIGFVKDASDVQRNGRLRVWIPELGSAPTESENWITVSYCSPFAGATSVASISKSNLEQFEGTQTSYGMWMIPPDIDNEVLVMFINGNPATGVWIGCLYNQFMNQMIPGMAADTNSHQYPGKIVPLAEYNKWDTKVTQPDRAFKPYEKTKFQGVGNQGLITDLGRGLNSSSARRESPSTVFGILTPGPVIDENAAPTNIRRKGGSSFIMDDGTGTEYIQLTTKSGAQIRLDETNGFVYLINRDGTSWVQMDQKGNIDIFGATSISMRAQQDINIRADRNINIEAGQNIYMKAAKDTTASTTTFTYDVNNVPKESTIPLYKYVGQGAGQGGNIVFQALNDMHTTIQQDSFTTVKRDINMHAVRDFFITVGRNNMILVTQDYALKTSGKQDFKAAGNIHMETSVEFDLKTGSDFRVSSGGNIILNSGTIGLNGNTQISGPLGVTGLLGVAGGAIIGTLVSLGEPGPTSPITGITSGAASARAGADAEIKQATEKINILATWSDPVSKFKRNSEALNTTVSIFPTYEPCPEHETFSFKSITGYTPKQDEGAKTYPGSGGAGSEATTSPPPNTTPGANNTKLAPTPAKESAVTKDFNMAAYQCQLKIHEGVKYVSYLDSVQKPTGGIGHLLRTDEIAQYSPIGTAISSDQVSQWFEQDASYSISGAMRLVGTDIWGDLTDVRKRATADLCYNLGEGGLSKFRRFLAAMKTGDYDLAGQSLRESKWFTQVGRRGPNIISMIVNNSDPNGCDKKFPP